MSGGKAGAGVIENPGEGRGGIDALVSGVRSRLFRGAAVAAGLWLGVALLVVLGLAWLLIGPEGWERGSAVPVFLDGLLLVAALTAAGLLVRLLRRGLSDARIAEGLDRVAGLARGSVLGSLELSRGTPPGVSPELARSSADVVLEALPGGTEELARPLASPFRTWARRGIGALALALPAVLLLAVTSPERTVAAWSGLLRPGAVLSTPALPALGLDPAGGSLPRGSDLEVTVEAPGRERVRLRWQFDGDVARGGEAVVEDGRARFTLGALDAPVEYRALAPDGARSARVRIEPEDPLLVTDLRIRLSFPDHTGRPAQQFLREAPPLEVPAGTEIRFEGRASRLLGEVRLEAASEDGDGSGAATDPGEDREPVVLSVTGDRFSGRWRPRRSGRYAWTLEGADGASPASVPPDLEITLAADAAPSVEVVSPGRDGELPLNRRQPLEIRASDDHGLGRLELVAYRISSTGERDEPVVRRLRTGGVRAAVARPVLDVSSWELMPGDTVRYRARVTDNAPRPRTAESREYVLRVPRGSQAARKLQEELAAASRAVDSLATVAERAARQTRDLERRGVRSPGDEPGSLREPGSRATFPGGAQPGGEPETSFESREEVRRALERQEELLQGADSIREELAEARRSLEEFALADSELRRDLEELESLLSEAASRELRESLRSTEERLEQLDARELQEALERLAESQETFRRRVEESLERFRRAAAEQDFRASAEEARDLADEESALADAMEREARDATGVDAGEGIEDGEREDRREGTEDAGTEADPESGSKASEGAAQSQQELAERASELRERMDRLEERLSRMGEQEARQGVQEAREGVSEAADRMERAGRSSRQNRGSEAARSARAAARQLQRSADQMERRRAERTRRAFQEASTEALSLARRQGELQQRMEGADGEEPGDLRGDEAAVLEGLRNLTEGLSEPASQSPESGRQVQQAAGEAMESLQRTLRAMEGRSGGSAPTTASADAVEALNRLARAAARAGRRAGGGTPGAQGSPSLREGLQDAARRQGSLARRAAGLRPGQGASPGSGAQGRDRLGEMAGEQESVAGDLDELARRPGSGEALGDLGRMADEARELAERLEGGRLDPETVRRQERLFHRLLDAGRSLEKEERSREREARGVVEPRRAEVEPLTEVDRGGVRYPLPRADVLRALPPAQRALVVRYFERLNRSGGSDGEGGTR